ncbi:MAG: hypothetical protein LC102_00960 [Ignavibacteriales bacterium]|nr:MAG: hypothetical protein F9K26_03320 [Ignavibacteriaceae bacterium]MBW7872464.1 hypothetical protein [Ignavibacteria bacterium]MCZ2141983.1 hypothetical protein [Ignavibacteriales bacterium]OQY78829.1 MAG: hypothetical protein B6D45_01745 [Ignavibacteriales bacterium UTCHB3]MBZ0197586.1 hypothetical protein [Ignavibacteriaceae bacterium]
MKKSISYLLISLFSFAIIIIFYGCKDTINQADVDAVIIPAHNVSYQAHIQPVLLVKCAFSGCHDDQSRANNLSFTNYFTTVEDMAVVVPYEPQNSKMIWALMGTGAFKMPPPLYPPLTMNQIEGIRTWIAEGAKNN